MSFNENYPCPMCVRLHSIRDCTRFLILDNEAKFDKIRNWKICSNCFAQSDRRKDCENPSRCHKCTHKHNTLLHAVDLNCTWISMTAMVRIFNGQDPFERLVIDPNKPRSSITLDAARSYGCNIHRGYTNVTLQHRLFDRCSIEVRCVDEDTDYGRTPHLRLNKTWIHRHAVVGNANLADIRWAEPYPYGMILGADAAHKVLLGAAIG